MATKTFFNLNDVKKEKIIESILDELSNNIYDKVSINKIIASANIPRGSFYQYFSSLDDAAITTVEWYRDHKGIGFFDIELEKDPLDAIIIICECWLESVRKEPKAFRAWFNMTQAKHKPFKLKDHEDELHNKEEKILEVFSGHQTYKEYTPILVGLLTALDSDLRKLDLDPVKIIEEHLLRLTLLNKLIKGEK